MANADVIGGPAPRQALLARTLVELAETLVADFDVVELLSRLADRCVEVLDVGAAGLMLACMCDLIVAAEDAVFSNPVLRMTGAGVELLVEPWELGIRKAKEFLWTGEKIDAQEAWRLGLVNRVVPTAELAERTRELAERVALVPPTTAQVTKDTINNTATLMGKEESWKYHFMAHHWMHNTRTALDALDARKTKTSMKEVFAEHRDD